MREFWIFIALCNTACCVYGSEDALVSHFDLTNDGEVDARELRTVAYSDDKTAPKITMDILHRADTDMNEILNGAELRTAKKLLDAEAQRNAEQWLQDHDTDRDGKMNEAELLQGEYVEHGLGSNQIKDRFREADTDNDDFLGALELMHARRLLRAIAITNAADIMKKYDSDKDHFVTLREAEILADEMFDLGPSVATSILNSVDHKKEQKINELQLVDYLSDLRAEAAIAALDKLAAIDKNGNGMITFDEIVAKYGRNTQKAVLKKIFSEVDINKNANIDPIEFISLQTLISENNREMAAAKEGEKKKRVITVSMPRSPELETLLQARRQHTNKEHDDSLNFEKRFKRKSDLMDVDDEQIFEDAFGKPAEDNEIDDSEYKVLTVTDKDGKVISNQKTADFNKFENFIDKMSAMIHRFADLGNTLKNSSMFDRPNITDSANELTRIQEKLSIKNIFTDKLKLGGMPPLFGGLNPLGLPTTTTKTTAAPSTTTETTPPTSTTTVMTSAVTSSITTTPVPTTVTTTTTTMMTSSPLADSIIGGEDKFKIASVKDEKGAVINKQFIADFHKFQGFMEQMQKDLHRIAGMPDAKIPEADIPISKSVDSVPQTMPGATEKSPGHIVNEIADNVHSEAPGQSSTTTIKTATSTSTTPVPTTSTTSASVPTTTKPRTENDPLGTLKDLLDPLHLFNPDRASFKLKIPNVENYSVLKSTTNYKEDAFGNPILPSIDEASKTLQANDKVGIFPKGIDPSGYKVIPSTKNFKEDAFGTPVIPKDKDGNYIIEVQKPATEVQKPAVRLSNEKGEVVHSFVNTTGFSLVNATAEKVVIEHKGIQRQEVHKNEEDDFFVEHASVQLNHTEPVGNDTEQGQSVNTIDTINALSRADNGTETVDTTITETNKTEENATETIDSAIENINKTEENATETINSVITNINKTGENETETVDSVVSNINKTDENGTVTVDSTLSNTNKTEANATETINTAITNPDKTVTETTEKAKEDKTKKVAHKGEKRRRKKKHGKRRKHKQHKAKKPAQSEKPEKSEKSVSEKIAAVEMQNTSTPQVDNNGTEVTATKEHQVINDSNVNKTIESEKTTEVDGEKREEKVESSDKKKDKHEKDHTEDIVAILSSENSTAVSDTMELSNDTSSDQLNGTSDSKRLKDDPLNDSVEDNSLSLQYVIDDRVRAETSAMVPISTEIDDGVLSEEAGRFRSRKNFRRRGLLAGGRPVDHKFEETLAETVSYNDPDFS